MSHPSFRVYWTPHQGNRVSGTLMARRPDPLEPPAPSAYGASDDDVLQQLEQLSIEREAEYGIGRFLWEEPFEVRAVRVDVNPLTVVGKSSVIGKQRIPLRVNYAWTKTGGGFLVLLPRFGWWFVLEDLETAPDVIRQHIAASLSGEAPKWLFEYRYDGPEYVTPFRPLSLAGRQTIHTPDARDDEDGVLPAVAEELVGKARQKRLPATVGIDPTFQQLVPLLSPPDEPSLLLVGPPGVGKTAFVQRMARHLLARSRGKHGPRLDTKLWASSADSIVAGMVYLGMWQERCLKIIDALSHEGDYLYLDRLTDLLQAQPGGATIADMLVAPLVAGEINLIAECDEAELERCRQRAPAFVDAFRLVRIGEKDIATTLEWLAIHQKRVAPRVTIGPSAYRRALAHLDAFRPDQRFPGKAFRFFSWLNQQRQRRESFTPRELSEAFARYSGLPLELISDDIPVAASQIAARLGERIIGQQQAVDVCSRVLARLKARLNDPERPVGTMFFVGPTGVGKTHLAKELARYLFGDPDRLIRIDMSELMTAGSSSRLLDVSPGVISLASRIAEQPLSVVLFDEIEKAHREVFDLLLGVLGEGRLTDSSGRLVDCRMTLIIMTSNLGAGDARPVGFKEGLKDAATRDHLRRVTQHFRPEFIGRLDHVIAFRALSTHDVERIVDLELHAVSKRVGLVRRNIKLITTAGARSQLAALGYHPSMGARPLKRIIEERVVTPLAVRMAAEPSLSNIDITIAPDLSLIG